MSQTYERVFKHIEASRQDVINRYLGHQHKCNLAIIECQIKIAVEFLDEAISRMKQKENCTNSRNKVSNL